MIVLQVKGFRLWLPRLREETSRPKPSMLTIKVQTVRYAVVPTLPSHGFKAASRVSVLSLFGFRMPWFVLHGAWLMGLVWESLLVWVVWVLCGTLSLLLCLSGWWMSLKMGSVGGQGREYFILSQPWQSCVLLQVALGMTPGRWYR